MSIYVAWRAEELTGVLSKNEYMYGDTRLSRKFHLIDLFESK